MKYRLSLVANKNDRLTPPPWFSRERLLAYAKATAGAVAPFVMLPLRALRYLLYMLLLFVRIPVQMVCRLTIVPLLLIAVAWGLLKGWTSTPTLMMVGAAFSMFLFSFLYDTVLLLIAPDKIDLDM